MPNVSYEIDMHNEAPHIPNYEALGEWVLEPSNHTSSCSTGLCWGVQSDMDNWGGNHMDTIICIVSILTVLVVKDFLHRNNLDPPKLRARRLYF